LGARSGAIRKNRDPVARLQLLSAFDKPQQSDKSARRISATHPAQVFQRGQRLAFEMRPSLTFCHRLPTAEQRPMRAKSHAPERGVVDVLREVLVEIHRMPDALEIVSVCAFERVYVGEQTRLAVPGFNP